ncbi:alpha/beta hydrolase domain-containing protein [Micromonospora sp. NPDC049081]|uniref:alpha/beta hydrolase domain-containing protein n=1 Tax=Micromonospora sp. NPDC049081 TaxID=3155150 RepID=UPI0033D7A338
MPVSSTTRRNTRRCLTLGLVGALAVATGPVHPATAAAPTTPRPSTATGATVANPVVAGPIARTTPVGDPGHGYPFLATDVNLAAAGYVEEEFFLFGTATRYAVQGTQNATTLGTDQPYGTRLVVRRPANTTKFNGVVIAEWNNVSNQWDQEVDWFQSHEHLIRSGYAWVGVSAQRAGLHSATGLKAWSPTRYGPLDVTVGGTVTDDSLSYDIFSQAVKAVRNPTGVDPLGKLPAPQYVIATGHSQSAGRLANYYNGVQQSANVLDAVVLHGGGGVLRTDLTTPVFRINSEGDVASGILPAAARAQADSPVLRSWEVAGASHGDWKLITDYGPLRKRDIGSYPGGYPGEPQTCTLPSLSRVPQHMVQNAVYDHTVAWVARQVAPPSAPPIQTTTTTPPAIARDDLGLALGGIRLAQHQVPLRVNSGSNTGPGFCFLDGSSVPLTDAQLATRYPTVGSYVDASVAATLAAADAGYLPASFTRDPAWYSDLRYLIAEYVAAGRITEYVAARLTDRLQRAEQAGTAGNAARAGELLAQLADRARQRITGDPAARDAVLRPTEALIALLHAADRRNR